MFKKIILLPLILFTLTLVVVFKITGWVIRRVYGLFYNIFHSIKNSNGFSEAYKNFATAKYAKSRLSLPEEVIALMAKIALSDGKISSLEVEYMSDTIKTMVGGMKKSRVSASRVERTKQKLFDLANNAKKDERSTTYYTETLRRSPLNVRQGAFMQIIAFALLDGISEHTQAMLEEIGASLKFSIEQVKTFIEQVKGGALNQGYDTQKDPYKELGCNADDDFKTIKRAYRRLVKLNHPDYLHGQGKDESAIKVANEKMQEINAAYEEIKRRRDA